MFGLGMTELIVILVIVAILFGSKKLPQLGEGLAKGIINFRKGIQESKRETLLPLEEHEEEERQRDIS